MSSPIRYTITQALEKFRAYVDLVLPSLEEVIYAYPLIADAKRPDTPYATIELVGARMLSTPYRRVGDTLDEPEGTEDELTEEFELSWFAEATVAVSFYGGTGPALAETLAAASARPASITYLGTNQISVRAVSDVLDTRILRDTVHEPSARQDYGLIYCAEDLSAVGTIETISYNGVEFDATYTP